MKQSILKHFKVVLAVLYQTGMFLLNITDHVKRAFDVDKFAVHSLLIIAALDECKMKIEVEVKRKNHSKMEKETEI